MPCYCLDEGQSAATRSPVSYQSNRIPSFSDTTFILSLELTSGKMSFNGLAVLDDSSYMIFQLDDL